MQETLSSVSETFLDVITKLRSLFENETTFRIDNVSIFLFCIGFLLTLSIFCFTLLSSETKFKKIFLHFQPALSFILLIKTIILSLKVYQTDGTIVEYGINFYPIFQYCLVIGFISFLMYFLYQSCARKPNIENLVFGFIFIAEFLFLQNIVINPISISGINQYENFVELFHSLKGIFLAYFIFLAIFSVLRIPIKVLIGSAEVLFSLGFVMWIRLVEFVFDLILSCFTLFEACFGAIFSFFLILIISFVILMIALAICIFFIFIVILGVKILVLMTACSLSFFVSILGFIKL